MEAYPFSCINKRSSLNSLEITSTDGYDWSPFGKEKRDELKMIENSTFYYQLKTNGYTHAWKEMQLYNLLFKSRDQRQNRVIFQ